MSLKICFLILSVFVCAFIGCKISNKFSARRKYFEDLLFLLNTLVSEMKFSQTNLAQVLEKNCPIKSKLRLNVDEFLDYVNGKTPTLTLSKHYLTEREYEFIKEMFSMLGRYDLDSQIYIIEGFKERVNDFYAVNKEEESKKSNASKKLGIMAGLAVGLLIL